METEGRPTCRSFSLLIKITTNIYFRYKHYDVEMKGGPTYRYSASKDSRLGFCVHHKIT